MPVHDDEPPDALLARAYARHRRTVEEDLLTQLRAVSPERFESIVIEVLVAMGYGGSFAEAAERIGRSGDGGIDGLIKEDRLGLDVVCVQAKRWADTVGRPTVQAFAGSLQGARARKGILITTSKFSNEAIDFAERIDTRIVLINGQNLVRYMFEHEVGVTTLKDQVYAVKRIDEDFFEDD
ncbi:MAG: restriction endonuclease [Polyangiaceae bacterium]|nr:restriction endonuclease [Polyangiaceae bacterium]